MPHFLSKRVFWLAQPSRQGWLGLLHVFTEDTFFYTFKELACALYERFYFPLDSRSLCDFSSTPSASLFLCCFSFSATARSLRPIIWAARIPALVAPALPMATVATGMPA